MGLTTIGRARICLEAVCVRPGQLSWSQGALAYLSQYISASLAAASSKHSGLFRVERGDDLFREDLGRSQDFNPQDIPCIAELDGDSWRYLDRASDLSLLTEKIQDVSPNIISGLGFCRSCYPPAVSDFSINIPLMKRVNTHGNNLSLCFLESNHHQMICTAIGNCGDGDAVTCRCVGETPFSLADDALRQISANLSYDEAIFQVIAVAHRLTDHSMPLLFAASISGLGVPIESTPSSARDSPEL